VNLRVLMAGLPESGKTTFLAALYELVSDKGAPADSLRLAQEPEDYEYFYEITQTWVKAEPLGHSNVTAPVHAIIPLLGPDGEFVLEIPDIYGEAFEEGWEGTSWPTAVLDAARNVDGMLLFIHAARVSPPVKLTAGPSSPKDLHPTPQKRPEPPAPTQTVLADLLEGLSALSEKPPPVVVVVSAWDTVTAEVAPADWLRMNVPLLWQMLEGPEAARPYQVFGVSAQGGDVTDPRERARLLSIQPPRDRISVRCGDDLSRDISTPIRWLLRPPR
jgi:hypothetical protein